jgi:heme o synthase
MERLAQLPFASAMRTYCLLAKPGIILGNAMTMAGGFALASRGHFHPWLFLATLIGLSCVIASACVFNNYIDRDLDKRMARTQNRALAAGVISAQSAIIFATILGLLGTAILLIFTNLLTASAALLGFFVYVMVYSFLKYRSVHGTLIGSVAGALPPVVGYCAVSSSFDTAAFILFAMITLWQMPHFFAIAIYRLEDYAAASIPVLPIKKGLHITKIHMVLYITAFIAASCLLTTAGYTGYGYLILAALLGLIWLGIGLKGFKCVNDKRWARHMFFFSLVIVVVLSAAIPFTVQ